MEKIYKHKYFDGNTIDIKTGETLSLARLYNVATDTYVELDIKDVSSDPQVNSYELSARAEALESCSIGKYNLELLEKIDDTNYRMIACIENYAYVVESSEIN